MPGRPKLTYLTTLPEYVPPGYVLVHNSVTPTRRLGTTGFRAWLRTPHPGLQPCYCRWAPTLGPHFIDEVSTKAARQSAEAVSRFVTEVLETGRNGPVPPDVQAAQQTVNVWLEQRARHWAAIDALVEKLAVRIPTANPKRGA